MERAHTPSRRAIRVVACVTLAATIWLPAVHLLYPNVDHARALAARARADWRGGKPSDTAALRAVNPEWDFMRRTFVALAHVNRALARDASTEERAASLAFVDRVIDDTLAEERAHGQAFYLLPYAHRAPFVGTDGGSIQSLFIDGEIAMMIASRMLVAPRPALDAELDARVDRIVAQMESGPVLSGESYPDECWTFCNTFALAALRTRDAVRGRDDHRELAERWLAVARARLVDRGTGLLVSSYTWSGEHLDGPEGSSIFMSAANLLLVDERFARDQYRRAKRELAGGVLGFAWAREWPRSFARRPDVDSGAIVPLLEASPGASGLAILGAHVFDDRELARALHASLDFAAFPTEEADGLRYAASNGVGDAVILYAEAAGPAFARTRALLDHDTASRPTTVSVDEARR